MTSVQVRYLNGDTDVFHECQNVGNIMVRVGMLHGRFAHEIYVILPGTEAILDAAAAPPSAVSVIFGRDDVESDNDALEKSFLLHAQNEDIPTCLRILERFAPGPTSQPECALCAVVKTGNLRAVEGLMAEAVSFNRPGVMKAAAEMGNVEMVRVLQNSGVVVRSEDALCAASQHGHKEIVEFLLAAGIRYDDALLDACYDGHKDIVELLLRAGIRDDDASRVASVRGHADIVELLLAYRGFDPR